VYVCPRCKSDRVYRSRTRSGWERWRRQITLKAPFRCQTCGRRFWCPDPGPWFSREEIDAANRAIASASLEDTITVPPMQPADADPEITALDARFSRQKPEATTGEPRIPEI
jgi:hypothetical protein